MEALGSKIETVKKDIANLVHLFKKIDDSPFSNKFYRINSDVKNCIKKTLDEITDIKEKGHFSLYEEYRLSCKKNILKDLEAELLSKKESLICNQRDLTDVLRKYNAFEEILRTNLGRKESIEQTLKKINPLINRVRVLIERNNMLKKESETKNPSLVNIYKEKSIHYEIHDAFFTLTKDLHPQSERYKEYKEIHDAFIAATKDLHPQSDECHAYKEVLNEFKKLNPESDQYKAYKDLDIHAIFMDTKNSLNTEDKESKYELIKEAQANFFAATKNLDFQSLEYKWHKAQYHVFCAETKTFDINEMQEYEKYLCYKDVYDENNNHIKSLKPEDKASFLRGNSIPCLHTSFLLLSSCTDFENTQEFYKRQGR